MPFAMMSEHMHEILSVVVCKPNNQLNPRVCGHYKSVGVRPMFTQECIGMAGEGVVSGRLLSAVWQVLL